MLLVTIPVAIVAAMIALLLVRRKTKLQEVRVKR